MSNIGKELIKAIRNGNVSMVAELLPRCNDKDIIENCYGCAIVYSGDDGRGDKILGMVSQKLDDINR